MSRQVKPCDVDKVRPLLPCLAPGDCQCWGARCWGKTKEPPQNVRYMLECPWINHVRVWWKNSLRRAAMTAQEGKGVA